MDETKILLDLIANQDDLKGSNTFKTLEEFPALMGAINDMMAEYSEEIPLELMLLYVSILSKTCQDLKPIYLRMLLIKEAHDANK